jgi:hypothetical protein
MRVKLIEEWDSMTATRTYWIERKNLCGFWVKTPPGQVYRNQKECPSVVRAVFERLKVVVL